MHPKNIHIEAYPMEALVMLEPGLENFVAVGKGNRQTIDFSNSKAVYLLNKGLLKHYYKIEAYDLPEGYLLPPIPGRVDYLHHLSDLIGTDEARVLDIGTGANGIYPFLGTAIYPWKFTASDVDQNAITIALNNLTKNPHLKHRITFIHQTDPSSLFKNSIHPGDYFEATLCNPPFFKSAADALRAHQRKNTNLGTTGRNFMGTSNELWCNGGEALFGKRMIKESVLFKTQVGWFTLLISQKEHLSKLQKQLDKLQATHQIIPMEQGNKKSRMLAWRFI